MTLILGSNNIFSENTIRLIEDLIIPPDTPKVISISFRNKSEDLKHGNWGRFYGHEYKITLNVPDFKHFPMCGFRLITRLEYSYNNRIEWLVSVLGHEYYHAWQWINERKYFHVSDYIEVGCEDYEVKCMEKWNRYRIDNKINEIVSKKVNPSNHS